MDIFVISLYILCTLCICLYFSTKSVLPSSNDVNFKNLQRTYLLVYVLGIAGDWLQGPYVYALYQRYGMTAHQIEILFVAGFGSSMLFGTFVGSLADKYGRRFNCILYGILYGLSCLTKHFGDFWILMIGRLFGGIATSILYSAFESWLIYESTSRGIDSQSLGAIFSRAYLGNSIVAILAGFVAQLAADRFGFVAPFDISLLVMVAMIVAIVFSWNENFGNPKSTMLHSFKSGLSQVNKDYKIFCLGLVQSLFEGCMYTFVLEWTPSLSIVRQYAVSGIASTNLVVTSSLNEPVNRALSGTVYDLSANQASLMTQGYALVEDPNIPHGYIFAGFMVATMIGSFLFKFLSAYSCPESFMRIVLLVSAGCFMVPIFNPGRRVVTFMSYLVFEVCVGIFWPSIAMLRGKYVPEETRSTVMNIFRIPLNLIVIFILLQNMSLQTIFKFCAGFLVLACYFQNSLFRTVVTGNNGCTSKRGDHDCHHHKPRSFDHMTGGDVDEAQLPHPKPVTVERLTLNPPDTHCTSKSSSLLIPLLP